MYMLANRMSAVHLSVGEGRLDVLQLLKMMVRSVPTGSVIQGRPNLNPVRLGPMSSLI